MYYRLENFYQNHRRYVKSRSDDQLKGGILPFPITPSFATLLSSFHLFLYSFPSSIFSSSPSSSSAKGFLFSSFGFLFLLQNAVVVTSYTSLTDCDPYISLNDSRQRELLFNPCGLIARSLFNGNERGGRGGGGGKG